MLKRGMNISQGRLEGPQQGIGAGLQEEATI